jgi:hypothetical protein
MDTLLPANDSSSPDTERRVVAQYVPQRDTFGYVEDITEDAYLFDVTDLVRVMSLQKLLKFEDDSYDGDDLWHSHPISLEAPHKGLYKVIVRDEIIAYVSARLEAAAQETPEVAVALKTMWYRCEAPIDQFIVTVRRAGI